MLGQPEPCVVIAGNGIAASALACLLRDSGLGVVLAAPPRRRPPRGPLIEALPQAAVELIDHIGLARALLDAYPYSVNGFHNRYADRWLTGRWTHVDRVRLADRCFTEAHRRGATVVRQPITEPATGSATVRIRVGGSDIPVFAAVDATGRVARWSRPVRRAVPATAAIYTGPGGAGLRPGVLDYRGGRWVYRLDHPRAVTVGVIGEPACSAELTELAVAVDVCRPKTLTPVSTCCASVQWADQPVRGRRLAVGDAALALHPIAGQGVRFALSSALAAAAVLRTWAQDPGREDLASGYYRSFVDSARQRHLAKLAGVHPQPDVAPGSDEVNVAAGGVLSFTAPSRLVGCNRDGRIVADECFIMADGGYVRSVGGVDLGWLRAATQSRPNFAELCRALGHYGVGEDGASVLISWALRHGVLTCAGPRDADQFGRRPIRSGPYKLPSPELPAGHGLVDGLPAASQACSRS
jgi:2-polyprenyl-6-methoxyphenol hydroxylase-like FAD-dependent oxidoreductase